MASDDLKRPGRPGGVIRTPDAEALGAARSMARAAGPSRERTQRELLLGAMAEAAATTGYEASRVTDVVELSSLSRWTFYKHFDDKEECFLAAFEAAVEAILKRVEGAGEIRPADCRCERWAGVRGGERCAAVGSRGGGEHDRAEDERGSSRGTGGASCPSSCSRCWRPASEPSGPRRRCDGWRKPNAGGRRRSRPTRPCGRGCGYRQQVCCSEGGSPQPPGT
jgi:Bacterial regulatory proteins, tetR family